MQQAPELIAARATLERIDSELKALLTDFAKYPDLRAKTRDTRDQLYQVIRRIDLLTEPIPAVEPHEVERALAKNS